MTCARLLRALQTALILSNLKPNTIKAHYVDKGYRGFGEHALLSGSVEEVASAFRSYAEMGYTDVIVRNFSTDQAEALASIERLARVRELL